MAATSFRRGPRNPEVDTIRSNSADRSRDQRQKTFSMHNSTKKKKKLKKKKQKKNQVGIFYDFHFARIQQKDLLIQ